MGVNVKHILNHIFYHRKRNRAHVNQWSCKGQYLSCRAEHKAQSDRNISPSMAVYSAVVPNKTVVGCGFEASVSAGVQDLQGQTTVLQGVPQRSSWEANAGMCWFHPTLASHDGSLPLAASRQVMKDPPSLGAAFMLLEDCLWLQELSFAAPA